MSYNRDAPVGLYWTGHPLIDMGVAGLTVFAQKRNPEEVTGADLEKFVGWAEDAYFTKEMTAWLSVAISLNDVKNPSSSIEKQKLQAKQVLNSFTRMEEQRSHQCTFFDKPALGIFFRGLIPLLNADDQCNFGADGQPGLPVSGLALTTIQAMSLAAPIVSGKAMIVATDDRRLLLSLVQEWQALIRSRVQLSEASGEKCKGWGGPRSRLIEQIIRLESVRDKQQGLDLNYSGSATIYHASNSGQGPDLTVYTLELPALSFVRKAQGIKYRESWQRLVASSWREVDNKDKDPVYARSNDVYEAVFDLPIGSRRFIRRFFLGPVVAQLKSAKPAEPKKGKKVKAEAIGPISPPTSSPIALWDLLELFVKEVVGMERTRIEAIRTLADRLAGVVRAENDRRLFQRIYTARKSFEVRQLLIQLGMRRLKDGLEPAIRFEEYLEIFEEGDELARADFGLAWDLTRMRVIEMLFENKWFDGNKEVLEDIKVEEEEI